MLHLTQHAYSEQFAEVCDVTLRVRVVQIVNEL